jgi:protein SCO1
MGRRASGSGRYARTDELTQQLHRLLLLTGNAMSPRLALWAAIIIAMIAVHPAHLDAAPQRIHLIDQQGSTFDFNELRGGPVVLTFISAHCDDACPLINAQIAQSVHRLGSRPLAVHFLTVTLDPERDTPLDMRRIAKEFEANPARWIVAAGDTMSVHALMNRYHVQTQRDARGYATTHTTFVYVLDSQLRVRHTLLASNNLGEQLLQEVTE